MIFSKVRTGVEELAKIVKESAKIARRQGLSSLSMLVMEKIRKREFHILGPSVPDVEYAKWISRNRLSKNDLDEQRLAATKFRYRPLISIITPVWNPPVGYLQDALHSVLSQTYDNWELCIADGASNEGVRHFLRDFANVHAKHVKIRFLERNLGISENSNNAMEVSRGEFMTFLDHDDLLAPEALFEIVDKLNQMPELDIIYSDTDRVSVKGERTDPLFKPDWSPDLMLSGNYLTHLCLIRSTLAKMLRFRSETDGAQDWDLFLCATEKTSKIAHIPKILYHWREAPSSVSLAGFSAKPYAKNAQLLVVNQYLERHTIHAKARFHRSGCLRLDWNLDERPLISIVLFSLGISPWVKRCIRSIVSRSSYRNFELIVVCGRNAVDELENVRLIRSDEPLKYDSANNFGARHAKGDILVFLDSSIEVISADWLQELAGWALLPSVGAVGAKILSTDRRIYHGGVILGLPGYLFQGAREGSSPLGHTEWYRDFLAVAGGCLATRQELFRELGGFETKIGDEAADVDFCLRATVSGYRIVYTPHAKLILRDIRKSTIPTAQLLNVPEYRKIILNGDPYFNPNLSYNSATPLLATS